MFIKIIYSCYEKKKKREREKKSERCLKIIKMHSKKISKNKI